MTQTSKFTLPKSKIIVIGDLMLDRYLYGNISRISPEAPVPVLEKVNSDYKPGGAANVALNINSLDSTAYLIGLVGDDENGKKMISLLDEKGISTDYILKTQTRQTTVKTRIMSAGQHVLRIDEENTESIDVELSQKILGIFEQLVSSETIDAIIFQDYDKGLLTHDLIGKIIEKARHKKVFIAVDPKYRNFLSYHEVDLFKPNLKEISNFVKGNYEHIDGFLDKAVQFLKNKINPSNIFITLGDKGIFHFDGENYGTAPTEKRNVVDVSGAGDVVISIATIFFKAGYNTIEIAKIANIAGGLACDTLGVAVIDKEMLMSEINKMI